jgi:hypothetical protein
MEIWCVSQGGLDVSYRKPTFIVLPIILAFSLWGGCLLWGRSEALDSKAAAFWHRQEAIVKKAISGHQKNDEFEKACLFFEQTTGLKMHVSYFTFGALPTAETARDLSKIHAWYKSNKYRLYWDEAAQAVKVRTHEPLSY